MPGLAFPLVTTGLQVLGNIYGQIQANKAQKKYDGYLSQRRNDLTSKLNTSQNRDYLDTDQARSSMEMIRKNMEQSRKATQNAAIQGGATAESVIASEDKLNGRYQDAVNSIVSQGDQIKQRDKYLYETQGMNLDNQQAQGLAQKVGNWKQFGENVGGATSGILSAWANGGFDKKDSTATGDGDLIS